MTTRTAILASCACLLGGIAIGRYSARQPDTIATETGREAVQAMETIQATATVDAHAEETRAEERVVVRRVVEYRDGPVAREVQEVEASSSTVAAVAHVQAQEARVEVREVDVVREVERRIEVHTPLPDWRVGGLVGISLRGGPEPAYGLELQRRVWGPVYLQAWGLNTGAAGVGVGVEF